MASYSTALIPFVVLKRKDFFAHCNHVVCETGKKKKKKKNSIRPDVWLYTGAAV